SFAYRSIIPYVLFMLILVVYPVVQNVVVSFQVEDGWSFSNYREVLSDPLFSVVTLNTIIWTISCVILDLVVGLGIALLLSQDVKGKMVFRTIILVIPWATPDIVAAVAWKWMYNDMYGVLNDILVKLGIIKDYLPWLAVPTLAKAAVIIANLWKGFAISAMFYLAALQTVPRDLYEAAAMDGANLWQRFSKITIPVIRPFILTTVMLTIIWTINYFPLIFVMTGGGPANATDTFVTHAYRMAFRFLDFSHSTAVSNINFIIVFIIAIIYTLSLIRKEG
ncbi:MAG: sugar ABC transporter permease, partial [Atribacterota bacterium]|nr:sugar ABC transporter permease [Atribacterota bacterium]